MTRTRRLFAQSVTVDSPVHYSYKPCPAKMLSLGFAGDYKLLGIVLMSNAQLEEVDYCVGVVHRTISTPSCQ